MKAPLAPSKIFLANDRENIGIHAASAKTERFSTLSQKPHRVHTLPGLSEFSQAFCKVSKIRPILHTSIHLITDSNRPQFKYKPFEMRPVPCICGSGGDGKSRACQS